MEDYSQRLEARHLARVRLAGMRWRTAVVRQRAIAFGIGTFLFIWSLIFIRMVTGHDPVLGSGTARASSGSSSAQSSGGNGAGFTGSTSTTTPSTTTTTAVPAAPAQTATAPAPAPAPSPAPLVTSSS
jgi:hypothetical protein